MRVSSFYWTRGRIDHIARHGVKPEEVEEAAFDDPHRVVQRLKKAKALPGQMIYRLLGQTGSGHYLTIIFLFTGRGQAYVITARDMTPAERRYYLARRS
ncbi:BrnT family toxin [Thermodesulfitimonas autotrophica]|uniref:BrnT family toxin n=1 Tax=Thermodesulfitimonas autotrophica TaxID=1894989 RepID=UPI002FE3EECF